jgi:aspartyl-tRNA(Asn)/glutamyl-tRNA(Gln) amidotransferase subunit C
LSLTKAEVEHIGELAKLGLTEHQVSMFQEQLSEILDHFVALQELDTEGVEPMPYPLPLDNVMRDDEIRLSLPQEDVLANAPEAEEGAFKVEAVLEE